MDKCDFQIPNSFGTDSPRENALNPSPSNVCSAVAAPASVEIEMVLQMNIHDIQHMPVWFVRVWLCA